jgi:hypothetical protein
MEAACRGRGEVQISVGLLFFYEGVVSVNTHVFFSYIHKTSEWWLVDVYVLRNKKNCDVNVHNGANICPNSVTRTCLPLSRLRQQLGASARMITVCNACNRTCPYTRACLLATLLNVVPWICSAEQCSKAEADVRALEIELQTQTDTARRLRKQVLHPHHL